MGKVTGVDVGGTFTDVVVFADGQISGRKVPTTADQSQGVASAVTGSREDVFLHGTTSATNALLEGKGAQVALVTGVGFEDLLEIARQDRPSLYDSAANRPVPLVERSRRFGFDGDLARLTTAIDESGAEVIAVALVDSYQDPTEEKHLAQAIRERLGLVTLASSVVSPEFREYERVATTALSAYLTPSVAAYLRSLDRLLPMRRRLVMTSSGGLLPFAQAPESAGRLVLSGPAGGAVAAAAVGRHHGFGTVLSFDMGGTSTDVCRITGGELAIGAGHDVGGRINRVPSVPIRTIGAGGGSIAWADSGGALRVGPHSAGASPGPAAYGLGGLDATVTDANLVTGHIPPNLAMGGTVALDIDASREAMRTLGESMGLSADGTAQGILEIVDTHMEHALRSVSVEEGADPREAVLVAFGGAGGLHASRLAKRLGIRTVLVPPLSGVFSALGLLLASPRSDAARTLMLDQDDPSLAPRLDELVAEAAGQFVEVFGHEPSDTATTADVRYVGQSHELEIPATRDWAELAARFEVAHHQRFGFTRPSEPIELVNSRAISTADPPLKWTALPEVHVSGTPRMVGDAWWRNSLPAGFELDGPAIVAETNSVVLIEEGDRMIVLDDGSLEISR